MRMIIFSTIEFFDNFPEEKITCHRNVMKMKCSFSNTETVYIFVLLNRVTKIYILKG